MRKTMGSGQDIISNRRVERTVYVALWCVVCAIPLVIQVYEYLSGVDSEFEMNKVVKAWIAFLPFFVLFWVHDLLLMPLLMRRRRKWLYTLLTVGVIAGMMVIMDLPHRTHRREREKIEKEVIERDIESGEVVKHYTRNGWRRPSINMFLITNIIFALFTVSINIAIKLYFRGLNNRRRIALLEAENTSASLQFLKYQINPHFFMNTLNNIHALIDIDAERARDVVVELSKLMRYVLYEIDKDEVTLRQEIDFINNYIKLMKIRLTDNVTVNVSMAADAGDIKLPPLLFIPFVENIFKHGVSYREPSVIDISLEADDDGRVVFRSRNSNHSRKNADGHHGIGLENLRRRLDLIYGDSYSLVIDDGKDVFTAELAVPAKKRGDGDIEMHSC